MRLPKDLDKRVKSGTPKAASDQTDATVKELDFDTKVRKVIYKVFGYLVLLAILIVGIWLVVSKARSLSAETDKAYRESR